MSRSNMEILVEKAIEKQKVDITNIYIKFKKKKFDY